MDLTEALTVLGTSPGATSAEVRLAYRALVRAHHPDVAGPAGTERAARVTQAYAVVRAAIRGAGGDTVPDPHASRAPTRPPAPPPRSRPPADGLPAFGPDDVTGVDGDTIAIVAPADEAYVALFDAAGRIGHVAYFDRGLGIIETIVRFEGGPSCSLVITLQGRAHATEAFCTLESIEATPTPPIRPVVEALVAELTGRT